MSPQFFRDLKANFTPVSSDETTLEAPAISVTVNGEVKAPMEAPAFEDSDILYSFLIFLFCCCCCCCCCFVYHFNIK